MCFWLEIFQWDTEQSAPVLLTLHILHCESNWPLSKKVSITFDFWPSHFFSLDLPSLLSPLAASPLAAPPFFLLSHSPTYPFFSLIPLKPGHISLFLSLFCRTPRVQRTLGGWSMRDTTSTIFFVYFKNHLTKWNELNHLVFRLLWWGLQIRNKAPYSRKLLWGF